MGSNWMGVSSLSSPPSGNTSLPKGWRRYAMKLFDSKRILLIHPFFWVFFSVSIIVIRLLSCGYEDFNKRKAYIDGQSAVIWMLPVEELSEVEINRI
jgi:hypothetical protein